MSDNAFLNNQPPESEDSDSKVYDYDPEPVFMDDPENSYLDDDDIDIVIDDLEGTAEHEPEPEWYVVHCYSGYENKVRHAIEQRTETMGMRDRIFDVIVPTEEEVEYKDGKRKITEKRIFPGYIIVKMLLDEDSWYVVRNTPGVTGFVGMGNEPTPLSPIEVSTIITRMNNDTPKPRVDYKVGQKVRIIGGPFNDFVGTVSAIDADKAKVRVMVDFFGRETPVELDFQEVEKS